MPCPHCGGHDRYEFKSADNGHYLCRGCGAGDGWSMVMKILGVNFSEAVNQVAQYLGVSRQRPEPIRYGPVSRQKPASEPAPDTVAEKARAIWQQSLPAPNDHPYLVKKKLPPLTLRQYRDSLVCPVLDSDRQQVNLQFIKPDGQKFFLKGGRTKGCFSYFGSWDDQGPFSWSVFVCEGVADAMSMYCHQHRTRLCLTAFSASNIPVVGEWLRRTLPGHRLVLVLDNDRPVQHRKQRPGMQALMGHRYFDDLILPPEGQDVSDRWVQRHG